MLYSIVFIYGFPPHMIWLYKAEIKKVAAVIANDFSLQSLLRIYNSQTGNGLRVDGRLWFTERRVWG